MQNPKSITPMEADKKLSTTQQNYKMSSTGMGPPKRAPSGEESKTGSTAHKEKADSKFNMFDSS